MDTIVTARIPLEIKEQGNATLKKIGATTTQLINAAYEYVLANGALPNAKNAAEIQPGSLSEAQQEALRASIERTTFNISEEHWKGVSYDDVLAACRKAGYEAAP